MVDQKEIVLSRTRLYELVWLKPIRTLAQEFGISDVALGKWCQKMDIPRPGVGYWQRIAAGKKIRRPKLPEPTRVDELVIKKTVPKSGGNPPAEERPAYELFEMQPENKIVVPEKIQHPHPLVELSRRALKAGSIDHRYGWIYGHDPKCLDMRVSPGTLDQALGLMDTLIKALDLRHIRVETRDDRHEYRKGNTFALVDGEQISFGVFESPHRGLREDWSKKMTEGFVPSGRLVLRIRSEYGGDQVQIRDGKRKTLRDRLNEFVVELHREAQRRKADRIERERRRLEWEERDRQERELARQREAEAARFRQLESYVGNWRRANDIREFLKALAEIGEKPEHLDLHMPFQEWMTWATTQADRIDPLFCKN